MAWMTMNFEAIGLLPIPKATSRASKDKVCMVSRLQFPGTANDSGTDIAETASATCSTSSVRPDPHTVPIPGAARKIHLHPIRDMTFYTIRGRREGIW
jgi:hypothetical protein